MEDTNTVDPIVPEEEVAPEAMPEAAPEDTGAPVGPATIVEDDAPDQFPPEVTE